MHDSLYFSDHHLQVREMVRDFAKTVVKPTAHQYDLESRFPWDHVKQMAELGLFGIPWPEGLGGRGWTISPTSQSFTSSQRSTRATPSQAAPTRPSAPPPSL